jgi:hypothetical protein
MCTQLRKMLSLLLAIVCLSVVSLVYASDSPILAEVRFHPRGGAEKDAGVGSMANMSDTSRNSTG